MSFTPDDQQYPATNAGQRAKARANRAMFDAVARRYDLLNGVMSFGLDAGWRRRLVELSAVGPGSRALDLCTGTGGVARLLAQHGAQVVGLDASFAMLAHAQCAENAPVAYVQGDALQLPFPADRFDAVTIAFGNRNVASLPALYQEMRRVARPGGRIASLEITGPTTPWLRALFFLYFTHLPPLIARLLGTNSAAYAYLPDSVRRYPAPPAVAAIMREAGLRDVAIYPLLAGAVVIHVGVK